MVKEGTNERIAYRTRTLEATAKVIDIRVQLAEIRAEVVKATQATAGGEVAEAERLLGVVGARLVELAGTTVSARWALRELL